MRRPVLILGGYGNFGKRIAETLTKDGIEVIIVGRNQNKADALIERLPKGLAKSACFDIYEQLDLQPGNQKPAVVINTCGPFQTGDYRIAESCILQGVHYIDLADGRDFVTGITALHEKALKSGVAVISGASTVPCLSSAVIEHFKPEFSNIESLKFGISPGQKAERGFATTQGVLTYIGKPLKPFAANQKPVYGWQDIYVQNYPEIGKRRMANCDIPDLDLFPARYGIQKIQFSAGLELGFLHLGLWALSGLIRLGAPIHLPAFAGFFLKTANLFNGFGSANGGMHMIIKGRDQAGKPLTRKWFIVALDGDGPQIPTIPAIILAKKLLRKEIEFIGAAPCIGFVALQEYIKALEGYNIRTYEM